MTTLQAVILAIVEGLTEYLPISSTGHLIITSWIMGINENPFVKDFTVIVQFGAILSVLVLYWKRFLTGIPFYIKLFIAFLPAAGLGFLLKDKIDLLLGDIRVVALALIVGGIALIGIDRVFAKQEKWLKETDAGHIESLTYVQAALIGAIQCLAFIPGVSRSASTIIGGLSVKLTRKAAAEFSFFLAVPTLTAATGYKLLKILPTVTADQIPMLLIGNVIAFIVGCLSIKAFVGFLTRRGFFVFGVYRIIVGALILLALAFGSEMRML
ncbi:MAG: undecaprenyl-diphosphate phosphatase [Proteobacteria bacterium]|nr:MAG: undecaprenyl-diphosphate phosphatase [Pseudomonadota bacterium]